MHMLGPKGKAAVVVPTGFVTAQSGIEYAIREQLVERRMLRGVVGMPSNIFATTGTNVSVLFLDKANTRGDIVLMDASKLGTTVKEGKNQKTLLSPEEENEIIRVFNKHEAKEDFSVVVSYEDIKAKNYSFSAGQYFEVRIQHSDLSPKAFEAALSSRYETLSSLFSQARELDSKVLSNLSALRHD